MTEDVLSYFSDALSNPPTQMEKYAVRFLNGTKGCGKSTWILGDTEKNIPGLAGIYQRVFGMKVVFVDTDIHRPEPKDYKRIPVLNWQKIHLMDKGAARVIVNPDTAEEFFGLINEKEVSNIFLCMEDFVKYVPNRLEDTQIRRTMIDCKNFHRSMAFMSHMYSDMPPKMKGYIDQYVIFHNDSDCPQDRGIKNRRVHEAYERVNRNKNQYHHEIVKQNS